MRKPDGETLARRPLTRAIFRMNLLFGYGSLLSPESASKTLQRPLSVADLRSSHVIGYRRTWTAAADVQVAIPGGSESRQALFLDLSSAPATKCNGALIEVTGEELSRLDLRERQYERIKVQAHLFDSVVSAFTYIVPAANKTDSGVVLECYLQLIDDALSFYPQEFRDEFWSTTDAPQRPLLSGSYTFSDSQQNEAAGRK